MKNDNLEMNACSEEEIRPGQAMTPEPSAIDQPCEAVEEERQQSARDLIEADLADAHAGVPEVTDTADDSVPDGAESQNGMKKIRCADLVSMWKYMMSPHYANRRLVLYSFLNAALRRGTLSSTVGFRVLNRVINREACEFKGVSFWKIDREDFWADVEVELKLQSATDIRVWKGFLECWCSFYDDGFRMSVENLTASSDHEKEGFIRLSPFLVPYMTNGQMDGFGEWVWKEYGFEKALHNPSLRDATELARRMGLTIRYLDVYEHRNMDSIIFFQDGDLVCGEDRIERDGNGNEKRIKTGCPTTERIPANTIVVNTNRIRRDYSAFNIYHECIHYLLHYMFFRLQAMGSNDVRQYKIVETEIEAGKKQSDPIYFMEKQADRGAYGLMLPITDTHARIIEEGRKVTEYKNQGEKFETIGKALSIQLGMPHFRMRARMVQLGFIEAKGALNYVDRKLIRPFGFNPEAWEESEVTFVIKAGATYGLRKSNEAFRMLMESGKYTYADGHVVRNTPRFVREDKDKLILTDEAANRVDLCCLRFVRQYVQKSVGEYVLGRMYYDPHYEEQTKVYLRDLINGKQMDEVDAQIEYEDSFPRTFMEGFDQVMEQNGETRESTACKLLTTDKTLREWLSDPEHKITLDFIVRITLMWQIPDWVTDLLIDRAMIRISKYDRRHQALNRIRRNKWDQGLEEANRYLSERGLELLEAYDNNAMAPGRKRASSKKKTAEAID